MTAAGSAGELIPGLVGARAGLAIRFGDQSVSWTELRDAVGATARSVARRRLVAVWAEPSLETCIGVLGVLAAGAAVLPINPKAGASELAHIVSDGAPELVLAAAGAELPRGLDAVERVAVALAGGGDGAGDGDGAAGDTGVGAGASTGDGATADAGAPATLADPAFVLYTSGTTGPPKGVVLSRRAVAANLDALASVWDWTAADRVVHALPLFHAHGLVIGLLGALRRGGALHHLGRFSPEGVAAALRAGGTMVFGVPTMYHRLGVAAEEDPEIAAALGAARLLVSGSAPLRDRDFARIQRVTGQRIVERYGLTETLMLCANPAGDPRLGLVGPPLPGVDVRLVETDGTLVPENDHERLGEVLARGPNLFDGYLNQPEATRAALDGGWLRTGDIARWAPDRYVRIVGRKATDLIKTGGYKVGAGEVEQSLLGHAAVEEAAVTGELDDDLGERIVAWVVLAPGRQVEAQELIDHVAADLTPHKRPRRIVFRESLPRNPMGKVLKARLATASTATPEREPR